MGEAEILGLRITRGKEDERMK